MTSKPSRWSKLPELLTFVLETLVFGFFIFATIFLFSVLSLITGD